MASIIKRVIQRPLIRRVELSHQRARAGESVLVTVSGADAATVTINGVVGARQYLQFGGAPGPRRVEVQAADGAGRIERAGAELAIVAEPDGARPLPLLAYA